MTGFDGEGWPWTASRARFTSRKTGSTRRIAERTPSYNTLAMAA